MLKTSTRTRARALGAASALSLAMALANGVATAQATEGTFEIDIPAQPLSNALMLYGDQADASLVVGSNLTDGKLAPSVQGVMTSDEALALLLEGSGLDFTRTPDGRTTITVAQAEGENPQPETVLAQAETGTSTGRTREKIIVTGQKREEYIQDVPIAISAFSQEDLTLSQIAGGPDLVTQIPNFTFTKTNFSGYSIQIRGIGTQAISATTDPAVAVAFNNTPFIRNRFFEQEFYDLERVEVLRGPQGTLYGRNATAGVVNLLTAKPSFEKEVRLSVDRGNFNSQRIEGMINIPLVDDQVALRIAGAGTTRDGYATNQLTGNPIDGRDLWSSRVSLRFTPNDRFDANLIWEHFEENDDRLRSGKQLCKKDVVTDVNGIEITDFFQDLPDSGQVGGIGRVQATFSQGCERASLYSEDSFQTVNGLSVPYYAPLSAIFLPAALEAPYVDEVQSDDLRVIESTIDPDYSAATEVGELQLRWEIADGLTIESETGYTTDTIFSLQDFNRFNTAPGAWEQPNPGGLSYREGVLEEGPNGGIFCDPQLGCSDRLIAVDISTAESRQFSQEFRLSSQYGGPFNFSLGANYLRYDTEDKYYVFINSLSLIAAISPYHYGPALPPYVAGETDNADCLQGPPTFGDPNAVYPVANCTYIDPNPIGSLNDQGHNYFLSRNPYKLISYATFGEAYWNLTENLKITAGLRYSIDKKKAPRIPTWTLASLSYGYPVAEVVEQEWREPTGRLVVDWKPDLAFTEDTLVYGSYARGYKAGGANPPTFVYIFYSGADIAQDLSDNSATRPRTFDPEFVDAFEIGSKNTLLDGDVTLNLAAFYYDYESYQISEIVDRSAFNRNFDAEVWGAEIEAEWWALENLRLSFKGGYEQTRIADGEQAIDLMDRTAGVDGWSVVRPFPTQASSCILPTWLYTPPNAPAGGLFGLGSPNGGGPAGCELAYILGLDPVTRLDYVENPTMGANLFAFNRWGGTYPGWNPATAPNNGEGFFKDLGGNELPNAPHYTASISGDYILPLGTDWTLTFHTDLYYQSESWWRVFQDHEFSRLNEYYTMNLAAILKSEDGWNIMGYVKNVTNETAITGAFLNSDDTGLTTNVFLTEPRLFGVRVTKDWTGGNFLGSMFGGGDAHESGAPYALTLTVGGQVQRWDAPYEALSPSFAGAIPPVLNNIGDAQNQDLDWGDGREFKLAYRPNGGPRTYSVAARYGKANGDEPRLLNEEVIDIGCGFGGGLAFILCPKYESGGGYFQFVDSATNWATADTENREEYQMLDFAVGQDFGVGGVGPSTLSAGVRYAQFTSKSHLSTEAVPDWYVPDGWATYFPYAVYTYVPSTHHRYKSSLDAKREFEGLGPFVTWDLSKSLIGDDDVGRLDLDWSLTGGVLFGKAETEISGTESVGSYIGKYYDKPLDLAEPLDEADVGMSRSDEIMVPTLGASLGLSYRVDRFTIGAGYRWERYYDVLDGGFEEEKSVDRTIDGPYLNVSVGFGG